MDDEKTEGRIEKRSKHVRLDSCMISVKSRVYVKIKCLQLVLVLVLDSRLPCALTRRFSDRMNQKSSVRYYISWV